MSISTALKKATDYYAKQEEESISVSLHSCPSSEIITDFSDKIISGFVNIYG